MDSVTKANIDGDVLVYRSGYAAQHTHYRVFQGGSDEYIASFPSKKELNSWLEMWGEDDTIYIEKELEVEPVENALYSVKNTLKRIKEKTNAKELKVWLTDGPSNFRINLAKTAPYKGNRVQEKPVHYKELRDYLINVWGAEVVYGEEADDAMSIDQWHYWREGMEDYSCICTIDKDLDMVPGWHYNFVTDTSYLVTEEEGMLWFYKQMLTGDITDNIIGIKGIGPKKADKILSECSCERDMYTKVLFEYNRAFGNEEGIDVKDRILENGRLLWMRSKINEWWSPPV